VNTPKVRLCVAMALLCTFIINLFVAAFDSITGGMDYLPAAQRVAIFWMAAYLAWKFCEEEDAELKAERRTHRDRTRMWNGDRGRDVGSVGP